MNKVDIPPVTAVMSGLCVLASLVTYMFSDVLYDYAFVPALVNVEPWRILTGAFLHSGILHLGFNVMSLMFLGAELEPVLKKFWFTGLYLASAIGGHGAVYLWVLWTGQWNVVTVGASGAIFGLFGALVVLTRALKSNMRAILVLLGINVMLAITTPSISWQAHLGGFITGALIAAMWWRLNRRPKKMHGGW